MLEKQKFELMKKARGKDVKESLANLGSTPDIYRAIYRPYTHLSPEQFLIAKNLLKEWDGCKSFTQRLRDLSNEDVKLSDNQKVRIRVELEVLGDLYRKGAEEEQAKN